MSRAVSAGILLYRHRGGELVVLLAHPGGPFFHNRDAGHWTIPKGEPDLGDELLAAAAREFEEETGHVLAEVALPGAEPIDLGSVVQASGKRVHCWAVEGELDPAAATSNTFEMPWPPGSTELRTFPEIDRVAWFSIAEARRRANPSQAELPGRLVEALRQRAG
ncbi:MAG TPA: NUDIX domain-containing protein [Candidatus Limnocylindrales bacterium]|nr:NUDIX domain-containing protein [Candidatus Limnocylindrales bacterium]